MSRRKKYKKVRPVDIRGKKVVDILPLICNTVFKFNANHL